MKDCTTCSWLKLKECLDKKGCNSPRQLKLFEMAENKIKIKGKEYKIYANCHVEERDGFYVMVNNFTGTLMTFETGQTKIRI